MAETTGALQGVRILDFTTLYPGPLASMLLADLGAEVTRIEAPNRPDMLRFAPPLEDDGGSGLYRMVNRNKRSIVLNLKRPGAVAVVKQLIAHVDVVLEQFRPGVMDRLGIGYEVLKQVNPRLIYCAISSFGQGNEMSAKPGHDINFVALAGLSHHLGRPDTGPVPLNALIGDVAGGTWGAVAGILAALIARGRTGEGQMVDISMTDGALLMNAMAAMMALSSGEDLGAGQGWLNGGGAYDYYRTADDRYLSVGALEPKFFMMFTQAIGKPHLAGSFAAVGPAVADAKKEISEAIATRTLAQWQEVFSEVKCCVEPVLTPSEAVQQDLFIARGMIVDVPRPDGSTSRQVGNPIKLSANPPVFRHIAHEPGQDADEVLAQAGFDAEAIVQLRAAKVVG